jgi:hypothetical protein
MFFSDELENFAAFKNNVPFLGIDIHKGQTRGKKNKIASLFSNLFSTDIDDEAGQMDTVKTVGRFKGRVDVYNAKEREAYRKERN